MNRFAPVLLACALAGGTIACGDSHDDGHSRADGGSGNGGKSGRGSSGGTSGGSAGAPPSLSECINKTVAATTGKIGSECLACVCESSPREAVACNANCWGLIFCFADNCAGEESGTPSADSCAVDRCQSFVHEGMAAEAVSMAIAADCAKECANTGLSDAGTLPPDMDAGN